MQFARTASSCKKEGKREKGRVSRLSILIVVECPYAGCVRAKCFRPKKKRMQISRRANAIRPYGIIVQERGEEKKKKVSRLSILIVVEYPNAGGVRAKCIRPQNLRAPVVYGRIAFAQKLHSPPKKIHRQLSFLNKSSYLCYIKSIIKIKKNDTSLQSYETS